ncbi:MAG TPA: alpha/beta hydrolase [Thermohalobaculum sp.]|nr:alpha/beta hydrolase [Thermohalobaculum sp.]
MSTEITDPEVLEFIARTESAYGPDTVDCTIEEQRRIYERMYNLFRRPRGAGLTVSDETIAGPGGPLAQRRYVPDGAGPVTVVYFHGGGYILGGLESHDDVCAEIALGSGCPVVSVDYRLCPEHLHPAPIEDCIAATRAALTAGPVIVAGDSAGGNYAGVVAQVLRGADIRGQVLIYPSLGGVELGLESYTECAEAPMLATRDILYYRNIRTGGDPPMDDLTFYPLRATDFSGIPRCFISAAGVDPLRDDGVEYDRLLVGAGVEAYCVVEPQLPHGHLRARHMSHRAAEAFNRIVEAIADFASR